MPSFPGTPDVVTSAPGRVNLIGEHTDYNGGFVLPVAIPLRTTVALTRRGDDVVQVTSDRVGDPQPRTYRLGAERRTGDWLDYVQGCTRALAAHARHRGFDAAVTSAVPVGSGLSSSAALEVALLRALRTAFGLDVDDRTIARIAHAAEHDFVGARVGVMDQMAASLADEEHALFLDAAQLTTESVPLPPALGLLVVDSGVAHRHAAGDYNRRRAECEAACATLAVPSLRALGIADLHRAAGLPAPLDRRVRHVVTENARVHDAVAALRAGDLPRLGALFAVSHASMRDDYEVSTPEVDRLVAIACAEPEVFGARLTGGGFGGAVVVAAPASRTAALGARIVARYIAETGAPGRVLVGG